MIDFNNTEILAFSNHSEQKNGYFLVISFRFEELVRE